ncbi:MAG: DUF2971 domain-containing protein, partial [Proteobacteria bacterium]|nr:DUF2971 domain-containing protein [Pseudomonadota bacterium]
MNETKNPILYKYYDFDTGMKTLDNQTLLFKSPLYYNDPFELESFNLKVEETEGKFLAENSSFMCCFTHSPVNPLMWAHYAEQHKGMVIGFDLYHDPFTDEDYFDIPIQHGKVNYRSVVPNFPSTKSKNLKKQDIAREYYCTKSLHWHYEEEVRLMKSCEYQKGESSQQGVFLAEPPQNTMPFRAQNNHLIGFLMKIE